MREVTALSTLNPLRTSMGRADRLLIMAARFLLASAFVGACLLCQAALLLGYVDWDWWLRGLLGRW